MDNIVYVVVLEDPYGESSTVHSIYANIEDAERVTKELRSALTGLDAFFEMHDVL